MRTWNDFERATDTEILAWALQQPWSREMAACQQDAEWHAEGDVWTHTQMVWSETLRLADWPSLSRDAQLKLLFTALFHDAGKPATSAVEDGRIRSRKHSLAGMEIARRCLRELSCDLKTREEICAMVRYHGRPPYLLERERPDHQVISLSWSLSNRLLYLFALADTRGRHTKDTSRSEEVLHLWKLVAEEQNSFEQPYAFANDHARFLFFRDQLGSLHYTPHEDYSCTVTIMSGLPGAGKDTWLARNRPKLPVVSLDEIRSDLDIEATDNQGEVIQEAREQCRVHLRAGQDFTFNATNLTRMMRQRWINLFAEYRARIEIIYLEPSLSVILEQNHQRERCIPEKVILRLMGKTEPPTITECHALTMTGPGDG